MWGNYLKVAWRFFLADRVFTFANLIGLAVGLASVIVIALHVGSALGSDRWLAGHETLYRVDTLETTPGRDPVDIARAPGPLREALLKSFPQIEGIARAYPTPAGVVRGGQSFRQDLLVADANFFSLLRLSMTEGQAEKALSTPGAVALSERAAEKYFGTADAVGKRLTILAPKPRDFVVSAVFETLPQNSHMDFDVVVPFDAYFSSAEEDIASIPENWGGAYFFTYARLRDAGSVAAIERSLPALVDRSLPQWLTGALSIPPHEFYRFRFVNVSDIPFDGGSVGSFKPRQSRTMLLTLSLIALLILAIAAINFANLTASRSTLRSREVALRKVLGAKRRQILAQFMGEAILLTGVAGLIGLSLVELTLPYFAALLGAPEMLAPQGDWRFWAGLALVVLVTAVMSGLYPSVILSRIRPTALFDRSEGAAKTGLLREALVVTQFAISIALIAATSVMLLQMQFTRTANLNFDSRNLLIVRLPEGQEFDAAARSFKEAAARLPGVAGVTLSSAVPSDPSEDNLSIERPGEAKPVQLGFHRVDADFFATYAVRPISGRTTSSDTGSSDTGGSAVINEAAVARLGFASPDDAVGDLLRAAGKEYRIAGVVPNLRFRSLHEPVRDEMFILDEQPGRVVSMRFAAADTEAFVAGVDRIWRERFPDREIERSFLDDSLQALYEAERRQARLLALFAGVAIVLSCVGLMAMAAFAARRRARELAIRKVLGARTRDLAQTLLWSFVRPVLLANLIAWPIAWWAMRDWLNGFAARIELGPAPFLLAGGFALAVALGAIGGQALKAARTNPIHALRYE